MDVDVAVGTGKGEGTGVLVGDSVAGTHAARTASRRKAMINFRIRLFCHKYRIAAFRKPLIDLFKRPVYYPQVGYK
jgi:hypothetical protein